MTTTIFLIPYFFSAFHAAHAANYYYEFQVETSRYCIDDLKDAKGNPSTCGRSVALETEGLTLPGMEDGILTTRSHVIIASDGSEVKVEAHPSYPYQYFINTLTADSVTVEHVLNGESHLVGQKASWTDILPATFIGATSLESDGWTFLGLTERNGVMVNEWAKESFQGVDKSTGANFSGIYMADLGPDTWTLYMDEHNEKPVDIIATNGRHGHVIHQEMKFTNFEKKSGELSTIDARLHIHEMYGITSDPSRILSGTYAQGHGNTDDDVSSWRDELLSGYIPDDFHLPQKAADWMPRRHLRSSEIIPYFTIEEGTAAALYFSRINDRPRKLMILFDVQLPVSCHNKDSTDKVCLFANCDGSGFRVALSLSVGIRFPDVAKPGRMVEVAIGASYSLSSDNKLLEFSASGSGAGCAVVWQLGGAFYLRITLCVAASIDGQYSSGTGSLGASLGASVSFSIGAPFIGDVLDFTINGKVGATLAPHNVVSVYGKIGARAHVMIAGASVTFDLTFATTDNLINRWKFTSGVNLEAWVALIFWRPKWNKRYGLVSIGPITF